MLFYLVEDFGKNEFSKYKYENKIGIIEVNRPKQLNALSAESLDVLQHSFNSLIDNNEVGVLSLLAWEIRHLLQVQILKKCLH